MKLTRQALRKMILKEMSQIGMGIDSSYESIANEIASDILSIGDRYIQYVDKQFGGSDTLDNFEWDIEDYGDSVRIISKQPFAWHDAYRSEDWLSDSLTIDLYDGGQSGSLSFSYYGIEGDLSDLQDFVNRVLNYTSVGP